MNDAIAVIFFKSKKWEQSIQFLQKVKVVDGCLKLPGRIGLIKAKIHRPLKGTIKTVTVSMTSSGKYFASILCEVEGNHPQPSILGKVAGIDLGLKEFAKLLCI